MFFVLRSNDSFNFPLGLIKYIVSVIVNTQLGVARGTSGVETTDTVADGGCWDDRHCS